MTPKFIRPERACRTRPLGGCTLANLARRTALSAGCMASLLLAAGQARAAAPYTAYVANYTSGTVTPVNTATNIAGGEIPVGKEPWGLAITPDGATAYVPNL